MTIRPVCWRHVVDHELRPALVVSGDSYNSIIPNVVIVVPVTTRDRGFPHHVALTGAGLRLTQLSFAMTEQPKAIDRRRIRQQAGRVDQAKLAEVDRWLRDHLGLRG